MRGSKVRQKRCGCVGEVVPSVGGGTGEGAEDTEVFDDWCLTMRNIDVGSEFWFRTQWAADSLCSLGVESVADSVDVHGIGKVMFDRVSCN